jgi:hypothetical protein
VLEIFSGLFLTPTAIQQYGKSEAVMMDVNGFAFVVMTTASAVACGIAYWAGKSAR